MSSLNISLRGLEHETPTALVRLLARLPPVKPKSIKIVTYTLSRPGALELNALADQGVHIAVVYNRLIDCTIGGSLKYKFTLRQNNEVHSKLWIIDSRYFVGSTNMSSDTLANLMIECTTIEQKTALERHFRLAFNRKLKKQTTFVI
jgi:phosphatidylserine/phosphatidylglycerophosphate/cardiolipin synthase-like enzyme